MKARALTAALGSVGLLIAAAGVVLFPSLAGAHHNTVVGTSACADATGTYSVTWEITNSEANTDEKATLTPSGGGTLSASVIDIAGGTKAKVTQSGIPGSAKTASLSVAAEWTNGATNTTSGSVVLTGDCTIDATPVAPTIAQAACPAPGQPTTPEYTIPTTVGVNYLVNGAVVAAGPYTLAQGSSVTITAQAKPGYAIEGSPSWTLKADIVDCISKVTVTPAVFANEKCVDRSSVAGTLVIAAKTGVTYTVSPASAIVELQTSTTGTAAINAGSYTVKPGAAVTVTAVAAPGYAIDGTKVFSHTYPVALDCTDHVTPATPSVVQTECIAPGQAKAATFTIPATTGVVYWVNDGKTPAKAGTYTLAEGEVVTINAEAITGYTIDGTDTWTFTGKDIDCTETATPATPTYTVQQCLYPSYTVQPATVTIPSTPGVVYSLDGAVVVAGATTVGTGPHAVTATAVDGYELIDYPAGGWTTTIAAVPCEVAVLAQPPVAAPSLAATGSNASTLAVLGFLVLGAGGAMVALTARRGSKA